MEFAGQPNRNKTTSGRSAKILQSSPSLLQWSKRRDLAHLHHLICRESIAGNSCNSFLRRRGMLQDVTSMSQASKRHSVKTSLQVAGPSLPMAPSANATCHEYVQTVRLCPTQEPDSSALFLWVAQRILRREIRAPGHCSSECRSLIFSRDERKGKRCGSQPN